MYHYVLHNLVVSSQLFLRELDEVPAGKCDATIRLAQADELARRIVASKDRRERAVLGEIEEAGVFLVIAGKEIWIKPNQGVDATILQTYLFGPVLATLLRQRGYLVLHASCITINGQAVAFLAESGWGKSTLAANFHARGYPVFVDDLMALSKGEATPWVLPGPPWVKLWPASAAALDMNIDSLPRLNITTDKRFLRVRETIFEPPVPLGRLYVLGIGKDFSIEKIAPSQAILDLVRHTRVTHLFTAPDDLRTQFEQCTQLLRQVPVFRLNRAPGLEHIPQTVDMILAHGHETAGSKVIADGCLSGPR